ncbi:MAG: hypothetical protein KGR26_10565, partial [Cyanobacteria bacterium REEB65]|nr:hypothetical protein [Cyanobacteria bacterium REEB65]
MSAWRLARWAAIACLLSGCDVLLISPTLPGLVPGIGQPVRGQVLDALSGQPIGHATVVGDLTRGDIGWATTDNSGDFTLYGDLSRRVISISRAGYTSVTYANGPLVDGQQYFLSPLFPNTGTFQDRTVTIQGSVAALSNGQVVPANALSGAAFLGEANTPIQNGNFAFGALTEELPGSVYSGILGGGAITGNPGGQFNFQPDPNGTTLDFDYQIVSIPFASASAPPWTDPDPLIMGKTIAGSA